MDNAGHRRNNAEVREYFLPPFEELIALMVALELHLGIALEGIRIGKEIHLHRVVNHQVNRHKRIDRFGIAAQAGNGSAHGSQVNHRRDAGKILHDHTRRQKRDAGTNASWFPTGNMLHIRLGDFLPIALAERRLKQDADRKRQLAQAWSDQPFRVHPGDERYSPYCLP